MSENLLEESPGLENSAAAAVWDVLEEIGTGSPGWNRCGAATARGRFVQSSGVALGGDGDRDREANDALRVFRESLRAKAVCLRQHEEVGGHKMCGADDFYTAMHEHNVMLEKEASSAICMMAKALLGKIKRQPIAVLQCRWG